MDNRSTWQKSCLGITLPTKFATLNFQALRFQVLVPKCVGKSMLALLLFICILNEFVIQLYGAINFLRNSSIFAFQNLT
jgi:hypothetical protein